mmetsp:Transcript_68797/g.119469  ORF Transcript_68797/g.119469 Transcript_68797/m.119469 type:complete len:388 (+) Transcript_68797:77-1240(+)
MAVGIASSSKAEAISVIQGGGDSASSSKNKSADAWHGLYVALMSLKSCSHPSASTSSTATTEASLSEVGSSHGGSSPRKPWGDYEQEEDASDVDPTEVDGEFVNASTSKRTRRRAHRRRNRGGRRSAARRAKVTALAELQGCDTIEEEFALCNVAPSPLASRDVVLLSDLHLGLGSATDQQKVSAAADFPGSPCRSRAGPQANSSPSNIFGIKATGTDASARVPVPLSMPIASSEPTSPCRLLCASPITDMCASPSAGFSTFRGEASIRTGSAHLPSSAAWPIELTPTKHSAPNAVPVTPTKHLAPDRATAALPGPPCHAWAASAGGIVSTSPMAAPGPCSPSNTAFGGAGSQSADKLRSWLQASGLPSAADIMAQLQAAAPDFYED